MNAVKDLSYVTQPGYRGLTAEDLQHIDRRIKAEAASLDLSLGLFAARTELNLTQQQLSKACGVPQGEISRIEKGKANPTFATICKLAAALNLEMAFVPASAS